MGSGPERRAGRQLARGALRDAKTNIRIAATYIRHLGRFWSYPRSAFCRLKLRMASFNAGPGNVQEAQDLSGGRLCWKHISAFLHRVTSQKHSEETIGYVNTIVENFLRLKGLVQ